MKENIIKKKIKTESHVQVEQPIYAEDQPNPSKHVQTGQRFVRGIQDGIPIALGYFPVSFTFGILAASYGFSWWEATLISMLNLTSAGQFAGLGIMSAGGSLVEMALSQFVINLRYSLMSISLAQKVDRSVHGIYRWLAAFGNTDEIFAVASSRRGMISRKYMFGLILLPALGWTGGTLFGAVFGAILPARLEEALGIALYGMFIAIVVPPIKRSRPILIVAAIAALLSCIFYFVPVLNRVSSGFTIIICSVIASVIGAVLFPVTDREENNASEINYSTEGNADKNWDESAKEKLDGIIDKKQKDKVQGR